MSSKHSFVAFYMSDWIAGTAGMPRNMWSLYFQICLYNWDKNRPMPESYLKIMAHDLPVEEVGEHLQWMMDEGKIDLDPETGFYCPRAIDEASKAYDLWEKKSKGGKLAMQVIKKKRENKTAERVLKESSGEPDGKTERRKDGGKDDSSNEESNPPLPPLEGGNEEINLDDEEKAANEIAAFQAETEALKAEAAKQVSDVAKAWNEMAAAHGAKQIGKMSDKRIADMKDRIAKYGFEEILDAIRCVPEYQRNSRDSFKAHIDWFLRDAKLKKLIEGDFIPDDDDYPPAPTPKPPVLIVEGEPEAAAEIRKDLFAHFGAQKYAWFVNDASFVAEETAKGTILRVTNKGSIKLYDAERIQLMNKLAARHGFVGIW